MREAVGGATPLTPPSSPTKAMRRQRSPDLYDQQSTDAPPPMAAGAALPQTQYEPEAFNFNAGEGQMPEMIVNSLVGSPPFRPAAAPPQARRGLGPDSPGFSLM